MLLVNSSCRAVSMLQVRVPMDWNWEPGIVSDCQEDSYTYADPFQ